MKNIEKRIRYILIEKMIAENTIDTNVDYFYEDFWEFFYNYFYYKILRSNYISIEFSETLTTNILDTESDNDNNDNVLYKQMISRKVWIKQIKYYYVFDDKRGVNMLFVTHEDRVYGLGSNLYGTLGLGHNQYVCEPQVIPELSNLKIISFLNGKDFVVCISSDHLLYYWGYNKPGKLCPEISDTYLKPMNKKINANNDLKVEVSCGSNHTLVLTQSNEVYGWGRNNCGQIGSRDTTCEAITTPERVEFKGTYVIKSVHCFKNKSFALTSDGQVFSWGDNRDKNLGHNTIDRVICNPKLIIDLNGIITIASNDFDKYFLSHDNCLYFVTKNVINDENKDNGNYNFKPRLFRKFQTNDLVEITTIKIWNSSNVMCLLNNTLYAIYGADLKKEMHFNFQDYCFNELQITCKTHDLVNESTDQMIEFIWNTFEDIRKQKLSLDNFYLKHNVMPFNN
jgi:hypothetical protein